MDTSKHHQVNGIKNKSFRYIYITMYIDILCAIHGFPKVSTIVISTFSVAVITMHYLYLLYRLIAGLPEF